MAMMSSIFISVEWSLLLKLTEIESQVNLDFIENWLNF